MFKLFVFICYLSCFINKAIALEVNVDKTKILMDTKFAGDTINVYGKKTKGKLVIIFKSKKVNFKIYNKEKIFGTWQNTKPYLFKNVYKFYSIYTEFQFGVAQKDILRDLEIGMSNMNFDGFVASKESENNEFECELSKKNFLTHEKKAGRFIEHYNEIKFNEDLTFNVPIEIPQYIKPGSYSLEIFVINDAGLLTDFNIFNINVKRSGFVLTLKEISKNYKVLYSFLAVLICLVIGFLSFYFTKVLYYNKKS